MAEADRAIDDIGLPLIVRPAFTLGGHGGGIARTPAEFSERVSEGLNASPINQVLLEESLLGWGEFELEVMRDCNDNALVVCSIENVDPMGIHTGDSVTVAPQQTLTDGAYQQLRDQALAVIRAVGVETGGSNIQFAVNPADGEVAVIEMNPRVSRSSALASKATGFPIAKIAARLAVGYALEEIPNDITRRTPASFEPTIDYAVVKIPRFAFEKFPLVERGLTTQMKSVGEAMAIGRTFKQAFMKALRSRELDAKLHPPADDAELLARLEVPSHDRYELLWEALRRGYSVEELHDRTAVHPWFLGQFAELVAAERDSGEGALARKKDLGFSDDEAGVTRAERLAAGLRPAYKSVDTCAAEFEAETPYFYSAYERGFTGGEARDSELRRGTRPSVVILGSGPNRIGQGIEFDYCCVHAAMTVRETGRDAVMINCNPETVSTDYDTSTRLYFEPLTVEDVLEVVDVEQPEGVIVQFGGQTPLRIAAGLQEAGVPLLGTPVEAIDLAEDRGRFGGLLAKLGLQAPPYGIAHDASEAMGVARQIGFPLLVRPSYVLGGRAMELCYSEADLESYLERLEGQVAARMYPLLLDRFLENAIELDVDALADGEDVYVAGIMQHVEEAGVHSGDSACVLPPLSLGEDMQEEVRRQTRAIALRPRSGRAHERPVRPCRQRPPLRDRGEPPRVAHGALRLEGDRRAARQGGLPPGPGRDAGVPGPAARAPRHPRERQGGGASLQAAAWQRCPAGAGDEVHGRGDGHRGGLPRGVRQGPGRGRRRAPARGQRVHLRVRHGQAGGDAARLAHARPRLSRAGHDGDGRGDSRDGHPGRAAEEDRGGVAERRGRDPLGRRGHRDQHPRRPRRAR